MTPQHYRFGLDTFGDSSVDEQGNPNSDAQTIRDLVDQAILADQLGLDNFNVGEHHRDDFAVSAPDTVLAGIATVTKNITLGSGVTVLSSEDPVRVYQRSTRFQTVAQKLQRAAVLSPRAFRCSDTSSATITCSSKRNLIYLFSC